MKKHVCDAMPVEVTVLQQNGEAKPTLYRYCKGVSISMYGIQYCPWCGEQLLDGNGSFVPQDCEVTHD